MPLPAATGCRRIKYDGGGFPPTAAVFMSEHENEYDAKDASSMLVHRRQVIVGRYDA